MRNTERDKVLSRGQNGRFISSRSLDNREKTDPAFLTIRKRKDLQHSLFQGYMKVFFLTGDETDFVPFSSKTGPFVVTYEKIMKKSYTLGRTKRSGKLQQYYGDQKKLGIPSKVVRISTRDVRYPKSKPSRVQAYKYRRLPDISNQKKELDPLKAWLKHAEKQKALIGTWDGAYKICCAAMGTYGTVAGRKAYVGFPVAVLQDVSPDKGDDSSEAEITQHNETANNRDMVENVSTPVRETRRSGSPESPSQVERSVVNNGWTGVRENGDKRMPPARIQPSPRSSRCFRDAVRFLDIARSNSIFEVLTKTLNDNDSKFHLIANPFVLPFMGEPKVPKVLKDALQYCQAKVFSIGNEESRKNLEQNLRKVLDDVQKVRQVYEMKKFQDMNWSFE